MMYISTCSQLYLDLDGLSQINTYIYYIYFCKYEFSLMMYISTFSLLYLDLDGLSQINTYIYNIHFCKYAFSFYLILYHYPLTIC